MFIHCPKCKSVATVPIAYGKPGDETMEAHKYGLIHVAGCVIDDERINRHCKACGCDFISHNDDLFATRQNRRIPIDEMNGMLDRLESDLNAVHQNIQREFMRLGREYKAEVSYEVFEYLREYHTAWDLFLDRLQYYGDPTVIVGHDGSITARYSNNTARIFLVKNHHHFYSMLVELAQACLWLGRTSRGDQNDIDDLKDASIAVQKARENIAENWVQIRFAATSQSE
jgi:hypothetical protein